MLAVGAGEVGLVVDTSEDCDAAREAGLVAGVPLMRLSSLSIADVAEGDTGVGVTSSMLVSTTGLTIAAIP